MKLKLIILLSFCMANAMAQTTAKQKLTAGTPVKAKYTKTASGLEYIIHVSKKGRKPKEGEYLSLNYTIRNEKDSILENSQKNASGAGKPVPVPYSRNKSIPGMFEVFSLLGDGDSATFKVLSDSLYKKQQRPPYIKQGEYLKFSFRIVKIMNRDELTAQMDVDHAELMKRMEKVRGEQSKKDDVAFLDYFAKAKIHPEKAAAGNGLYYQMEEPGNGPLIKNGDTVFVYYAGMLTDGTYFDSNMEDVIKANDLERPGPYPPIKVVVGQHRVIEGWDEGLKLFKMGSKGKLYIPSYMAYGPKGFPPTIPVDANLIFTIKIADVNRK